MRVDAAKETRKKGKNGRKHLDGESKRVGSQGQGRLLQHPGRQGDAEVVLGVIQQPVQNINRQVEREHRKQKIRNLKEVKKGERRRTSTRIRSLGRSSRSISGSCGGCGLCVRSGGPRRRRKSNISRTKRKLKRERTSTSGTTYLAIKPKRIAVRGGHVGQGWSRQT